MILSVKCLLPTYQCFQVGETLTLGQKVCIAEVKTHVYLLRE
jgi:hypothetical protein